VELDDLLWNSIDLLATLLLFFKLFLGILFSILKFLFMLPYRRLSLPISVKTEANTPPFYLSLELDRHLQSRVWFAIKNQG